MQSVTSIVDAVVSPIANSKYISLVVQVFFMAYIGAIAKKLPTAFFDKFLSNNVMRFLGIFFLIYLTSRDTEKALVGGVFILAIVYIIEMVYGKEGYNLMTQPSKMNGVEIVQYKDQIDPEFYDSEKKVHRAGIKSVKFEDKPVVFEDSFHDKVNFTPDTLKFVDQFNLREDEQITGPNDNLYSYY